MSSIRPQRAFLCIALAAAASAHAAWQLDFAANGTFESDVNRDGQPDGWRTATFKSQATTAWDSGVAHSGRASVRVDNSKHATDKSWDKNTGRWVQAGRRKAKEGETYSVRGWIKTDLTEGRASLTLAWFAGGKWLHEDSSERVTGKTDWVQKTLTVAAPARADSVAVYLILQGGRGSAWFDDVSMVQGDRFPENLRPLDIRAACNTRFRDDQAGDGKGGWTDQGPNDARSIPLGRQRWRGIPFDVVDPGQNAGKSCIVLRGRGTKFMPRSCTFSVGRKCDVVYFLHACAWPGAKGKAVASYTIVYADGQTREVALRNGHEVVDWWHPRDTNESAAAWEGSNAESPSVGLNVFPWANPRPDAAIASVRMQSAGAGSTPILAAVTTGRGPAVLTEARLRLEFTDTEGWYEWAFALDDPTLEEIDLSFLLDPPAGKHGFVTVGKDGHFHFGDGSRARFFGTNVGGRSCAPDKKTAEIIAARLAKYGVNLLRLHAPDSRWATLIDYRRGNSRHLNPDALDKYDYFVAQLKKRGIYVYFDLLDYRSFKETDGVRDAAKMDTRWTHSLKGASIFDRRMIELQKEFATQLLTHKNPYTGKRYVDEPALAVQEITNENSLFYLSNTKLMLPSYVEDLARLWNQWLTKRFGDRARLAKAWTNERGECAILPDEDPGRGTVRLPLQHLYADLRSASYVAEKSPARLTAMTRFLYELDVAYYKEMIQHLRGLGLKCPITGTNQDFSDASNSANAYCDFTSRNNYWRHPNMRAKPFLRFSNASMVSSSLAKTANPVANVASSTVVGKPMIAPEFNFPWPNEWRAECLPLMAAYGRLQDWDGLLYFAYSPEAKTLSSFGNQSDPVRWGQMPLAALLFLRGDIAPAKTTIHVGVSAVDQFGARPHRTRDRYSPYRILPYISKVRNAYFDSVYDGGADVVVASGHSASGDYSRAKRAILFADWPFVDEAAGVRDRGHSARQTCRGLQTRHGAGQYDTEVVAASVPSASELIQRGGRAVGFVSDRLCVFPCASADESSDAAWLHRLYLDAARRWQLPGAARSEEAGKVFRSDTGELALNCERGLFTAIAPRVRIATGFLGRAGAITLGEVTVQCRTPFASVSLVSLDRQPVEQSRRLLLTAVARSENTGQAYLKNHSALPERGRLPVIAEPVDATIRVPARRPLSAFPLTPTGRRRPALVARQSGKTLTVQTLEARSPWILLATAPQ